MGDIRFSTNLRNDRAQQVVDDLDAAATPGYIEFYGGGSGRPAAGAAVTDQTLIAICELSDPSGTVSNGVTTFNPVSDELSALADEDIEWARAYDGDDVFVMDLGCGLNGSGKSIIFNTLTARIGGVVQILSGSLTEGNA